LVRSACRDLNNIDEILSSKSGIRNATAIIAIILANISVSFMQYDPSIITLIRAYSIVLLLDSLRTYIRIVFKSFEKFKWISVSEIVQSLTYFILIVASINLNYGVQGIVCASMLSVIISFMVDYINSKKYSNFRLIGGFEIDKVFLISASIFTLTNIMWLIISKIDILMLSILTTSNNVAQYGVANRIILFCMMGVSIVSNVIYPPMIKSLKEGYINIKNHLNKIFGIYLLILTSCSIVFVFSTQIVTLIADAKYLISAEILNILLIYLFVQALSVPIKLIMYGMDREKLLLIIILPLPVIKIVLNLILFDNFGLHGIAFATVFVYSLYLLSLYWFNRKMLKEIIIFK